MLTLEETKAYLRVDNDEEDEVIKLIMSAAHCYLQDAIGKNYDVDGEREKLIAMLVVQDLYDQRGLTVKEPGNRLRHMVSSFLLQLQLEEKENGTGTTQ